MARWRDPGHDPTVTVTSSAETSIATAVARWWQAVIAVVIATSLVIQLALLVEGGADANSGQSGISVALGVRLWRLFSYFTIQSNLIVLAVAVVAVLRPLRNGPIWNVVRLDALLGITITGLVYAIVLAPQVHLTGAALVATIGFHYVSPWATVLAWLVFGPRPRMTWLTVLGAFVWPVAWLVYIFAQGAFTRWYPYPFLDVTKLGFATALRNALFVLVLGVVLACVAALLDRVLRSLLR
jgi:hypothetical protein